MLSAGFREGAAAYTKMAEVILAQRMLVANADPGLLPQYEQLGEVARRLFGLLHPYDTVMRQLAVLAPADSEENRARVLAALRRRGRRGASVSQLARACSLSAADVEAALPRLERGGTVQVRNPGDRAPAYVLAELLPQERPGRASRRRVRPATSTTAATAGSSRAVQEN
jgi:DNA-binding MarR family transcriptional regulator